MICVSVTPTSRTLAKVDLFNAAGQGDIVELCIDKLIKEPDFNDLFSTIEKPILISCRKKEHGGQWEGTDEERFALLRQAIVAGPDYVELDAETAAKVPRFGKTKRVISFIRLDRPEYEIDQLYEEAVELQADIVKFAWPTRTLDEAWPLLASVSQKRAVPIVGQGFGRPELSFSLLGRKYGSPWIYAALEQGMETHQGQASVFELKNKYAIERIERSTKFVAVAGFDEAATATTRILNSGFKQIDQPIVCLPMEIQKMERLGQMFEILKIKMLLGNAEIGSRLGSMIEHASPVEKDLGYFDLAIRQPDGWHGFNLLGRCLPQTISQEIAPRYGSDGTVKNRSILIIGANGPAVTCAHALTQLGGQISMCDLDDKHAKKVCEQRSFRHIPFQGIYSTHFDILVLANAKIPMGTGRGQVNPSLYRPHMTLLDISQMPIEHPLTTEARERAVHVCDATELYLAQLRQQFHSLTGQPLPEEAFAEGLKDDYS